MNTNDSNIILDKSPEEIKHILSQANSKLSESKDALLKSFYDRFELGVLANMLDKTLSYREQADYLHLNMKELNLYKRLAKKFNNDINKFKLYVLVNNFNNFTSIITSALKRNVKRNLTGNKVGILIGIRKIIKEYRESVNPSEIDYTMLFSVMKSLSKLIPVSDTIDRHYIKYCDCCCCGEEAWGDGHKIRFTDTVPKIPYPICQDCIEEDREVDMNRVAKLYYVYSKNIEQAYQERVL